MTNLIMLFSHYAALFMEGLASLIIVCGSIRALFLYGKHCVIARHCLHEFTQTRLRLGHSLSLGLEFLIGADILKSAVAPTWQDLGRLAAIVAIRSVINFLLMWEMKQTVKAASVSELEAR